MSKLAASAVDLITRDHRRLEHIFQRLVALPPEAVRQREEAFGTLKNELMLHRLVEEDVVYPAFKERESSRELVLESYAEHAIVETLVGDLDAVPYDHESWGPKLAVLRKTLERHMRDEEAVLLPTARETFDSGELQALGSRMAEKREALVHPRPRPSVFETGLL